MHTLVIHASTHGWQIAGPIGITNTDCNISRDCEYMTNTMHCVLNPFYSTRKRHTARRSPLLQRAGCADRWMHSPVDVQSQCARGHVLTGVERPVVHPDAISPDLPTLLILIGATHHVETASAVLSEVSEPVGLDGRPVVVDEARPPWRRPHLPHAQPRGPEPDARDQVRHKGVPRSVAHALDLQASTFACSEMPAGQDSQCSAGVAIGSVEKHKEP